MTLATRLAGAAVVVPLIQPVMLGGASTALVTAGTHQPAAAQNLEAVAKIAQAITVRIEGATQGSGVLVKRDGNRYTVLTAWHVVSGQRPGEELDIYTPDGQHHRVEQGSLKRLGQVDMAVLTFSSPTAYEVARVGDVKSVSSGDQVLVAGFPAGANGKLKYDIDRLIANAAVGIDEGYQLLYTNETSLGMSGGSILTSKGSLIGIHGRGEIDEKRSGLSGELVKTGINQGVPISYFNQFLGDVAIAPYTKSASTADDYLAQARSIFSQPGRDRDIIKLASLSISAGPSAEAFFLRGFSYEEVGSTDLAFSDLDRAIAIDPNYSLAIRYRGILKEKIGNIAGACADWKKAAAMGHQDAQLWYRNQCMYIR